MKTRRKNILLVFDGLRIGGIASLNAHIFKTLADMSSEYNFYLLCSIAHNSEFTEYSHIFSFCRTIYTYKRSLQRSPVIAFFETVFKTRRLVKKIAKKIDIDFVIFNHPYSALGVILSRTLQKNQMISIFHGAWYLEKEQLHTFRFSNQTSLQKISWALEKNFYRLVQGIMLVYAHKTLCCSNYAIELLRDSFNITENIFSLHVPSFIMNFQNPFDTHKQKKNIGLDKDHLVFIAPSRFEPRKGLHLLIDAIRILRGKTKKKITFLFMGPLLPSFNGYFLKIFSSANREKSNIQIFFLKTVTNKKELYSYYSAADALLMPSVDLETFGMTTLEALSLGIPVIGLPTSATNEILGKISKNLLAKKVSSSDLAQTLSWFSKLSEKKKQLLKVKCLTYVKKYHDAKKTLSDFKYIFQHEYY